MLAIKSENKLLEVRMIAAYEFLYNRGVEEDEIFEILSRIFELTSSPTLDAKDSLSDNKMTQSTHLIQATHENSSRTSEVMVQHQVHRRNDCMLGCYLRSMTSDTFDIESTSCRKTRVKMSEETTASVRR